MADNQNIPIQQPKVYPNAQPPVPPPVKKKPVGLIIALSAVLVALVVGLAFLIPTLIREEGGSSGRKECEVTAMSSNSDYGTVTGGGTYREGKNVTLTAVPKDGCIFAGWSDGHTEAERTVEAGEEASYTAVFYGPLSDWTQDVPEDAIVEDETTFYQADSSERFTSSEEKTPAGCVLVEVYLEQISTERFYVPDYWPDDFDSQHDLYDDLRMSVPSDTELTDVTETGEGYIYYHWCRYDRLPPKIPTNRKVSTTEQGEFDTFHAYYSTREPMASGSVTPGTYHANSSVPNPSEEGAYHQPDDTCSDTFWYFSLPVTSYEVCNYKKVYVFAGTDSLLTERPDNGSYEEVIQYRYRPQ